MDEQIKTLLESLKIEIDKEKIQKIIGELGSEIVSRDIVCCNGTVITPYWIETYFNNPSTGFNYGDIHTNGDELIPEQKKTGIFYSHSVYRHGRKSRIHDGYGIDACFGCDEYALGFLLKGIKVKVPGDGTYWWRQQDADHYLRCKCKLDANTTFELEDENRIPKESIRVTTRIIPSGKNYSDFKFAFVRSSEELSDSDANDYGKFNKYFRKVSRQ